MDLPNTMYTSPTPIALFTFNRPDHTQSALSALANCFRLADCQLVIYCDGPKTPAQEASVASTREVVKDWAPHFRSQIVERVENRGLAHSIVSGVTELCQKWGRVIVIEDDLVVSPDFLDYMLQALDRYRDFPNVYQISGFMYPIEQPPSPDAFFLPLTTTWGWATWERAWRAFDWKASAAMQRLADPQERIRFDLDGNFPYTSMLNSCLEGRNDSWGILWWYAVFNIDGLVLHPRQSLVWNGGFDASGIHSGAPSYTMQSARAMIEKPRLSNPILFPGEAIIDHAAFDRLKSYLRSRSTHRGYGKGVLRRMMRTISSLHAKTRKPIRGEV